MSPTRRPHLAALVAVTLALLTACTPAAPSPQPTPTLEATRASALQAKAVALTEDMERGDYSTTLDIALDKLRAAGVNEEQLKDGWQQLVQIAGPYETITGSYATAVNEGDVVVVVAKHATQSLRVLYSFAKGTEKLNGIHLNVATADEIAKASGTGTPGTTATPAPPGTHSVDTAVTVGEHKLPGTLVTPVGEKRPIAVVMLAGSGPQDRDETIGAARNKPLRDLADALAAHGISSLRFDKRTFAAPSSFTPSSTLEDEYFADARAAIALAGEHLPGHTIFVIGHSQGAMVLPNVLQQNPSVAGGVSLAGSPRNLFDIIYDQNVTAVSATTDKTDAEKKAMLADARRIMDEAKTITSADDTVPTELNVMSAAYIASLNALHQDAVAKKLTVPMLFAQGEADVQVSMASDFDGWKTALAGRPNATFISYPGLNHLFMKTQGLPAPADYDAPAVVDERVGNDVAVWLIEHAA